MSKLDSFFKPRSISIIGASRDKSKIGNIILTNIIESGYKGDLYPINPYSRKIEGYDVFKSVLDVKDRVDLAVIAIPAKFVLEVLEECGQKGIKNIVIISAGFGEGDEDGMELEIKMREVAGKFHINILGPNCLGFINTHFNLDATFTATSASKGGIAFVSQSGAMGTSFLDWAKKNHIGLSYFISVGNKIGINENDLLESFKEDPNVKAIMIYLEDFADGSKFFKLAKEITLNKPIIVLKPGKSKGAKKAMLSHTGSIAQDSKIINTAMNQSGCLQVSTVEELFNITRLLSWQPLIQGNHVAIVTNAGGVGIQTVDDLEANGLDVTELTDETEKDLAKKLPKEANIHNPIDILGDALADRYKDVLSKVIEDTKINAVLVILTPQQVTESLLTAKYVNEIADAHNKTVVTSFVGGESIEEAIDLLAKEKIPQFSFPNDAARALGLTWTWAKRKLQKAKQEKDAHKHPTLVNPLLKSSKKNHMVDIKTTQSLFNKFEIPLLPSFVSDDLAKLEQTAKNMNYPVVLKLSHPALIHKTEFKAVRLNINNKNDLSKEYKELKRIAKTNKLIGASFEIQPFIKEKLELIIGIKKDENKYLDHNGRRFLKTKGFGHAVLFGAGGIYAEVYEDVSIRLLPVSKSEIIEMISETKVSKILYGARGKIFDKDGVVDLIYKLNSLVEKNNNISEIDINPLFVSERGVYVSDLKLFV